MVKGKVISGLSGEGRPGYLSAYDTASGALVWRLWTTPRPGEEGYDTWGGAEPRGASLWTTGSYDPELDILYWQSDGPAPLDGDLRPGDNLFSNCILAIDPDSGRRLWHFQVIPHEGWDYDAIGELVLADLVIQGRPRKALFQANRGGFFVVLDRVTGKFIHGAPFIESLNWASGLDSTGRPIFNEDKVPKLGMDGPFLVGPRYNGGKNWPHMAFSPRTGLAYFYAHESVMWFDTPRMVLRNGEQVRVRGYWNEVETSENWMRFIAVDVATARRVWHHAPPDGAYTSALATAGGLVFAGEGGGYFSTGGNSLGNFIALEESSGEVLWRFKAGAHIVAPASTFTVDGEQHILVGVGNTSFFAFALPGE